MTEIAEVFCDPERPKDWCHFENIMYDGVSINSMQTAHTYFLIANWINWLAPTGYWVMWVFLILDYETNIKPFLDDALAFVTTVTDIVALIGSSDPNGDGVDN